jgi:isoquinoline 1-oxidoreductase subunit beta
MSGRAAVQSAGGARPVAVNRREFIGSAAAAGSLVVGFPLTAGAQSAGTGSGAGAGAAPEITAWVVVQPDERVVIRIARSEMGQGSLTGLAQLVAEELECDWARVTTEYPTPGQNLARKRAWGNFSTGGSRGIRESHEYVRKGGATARTMLVQAAADEWKGVVTHAASNRRTTYGKVATAAAKLTPPENVALKDPKDWKLVGARMARLDTVEKTNGAQIYGADLKLPGMLNAAIAACPVFGGKLKSHDAAAVMKLPGVKKVVPVGDYAVAVVADTWWHAKKALDALPVVWDFGAHAGAQQAAFNQTLRDALSAEQAAVGNSNGDVKAALADTRINAVAFIGSIVAWFWCG